MDTDNQRPAQSGDEPVMDTGVWRSQCPPDLRPTIVNEIIETLKRRLPFSGQEGLQELSKIAIRFEEKIYTTATSKSDYQRKISMKMLTMETKAQNNIANSPESNSASNSKNPSDAGSQGMQSQIGSLGQLLPIPMAANRAQACQRRLFQSTQNNVSATGVQGSTNLTSSLPPVGGLPPIVMPNVVGQNSNLQNIQNLSAVSQNPVGNSMEQGVSSNIFAGAQGQMLGRQQEVPQQQLQSQNPQHYLYQQQLMKQKYQQGSIPQSCMQTHMQQQQQKQTKKQQNLLESTQLQASQQSIQPSGVQPTPPSGLQQNHQSSIQLPTEPMQNAQSVLRQQQHSQQIPIIHQEQTAMLQPNSKTMQQNKLNGQQNKLNGQLNNIPDMHHQQQRFLSEQNSLFNQQQPQQLMSQQNNLPNIHQQQQLGPLSKVTGLQQWQQQQLLGAQSGNSSMQTNQHAVHMLQQSKIQLQQQTQQSAGTLLLTQGQQSEQQQLLSQIQSQPGQLQEQFSLQQQPNSPHADMQQRLQTSGSLLQSQNIIDQQKQIQSQKAIPEASSNSLDCTAQTGNENCGDQQEDVYQKIKVMKEAYFPELNEIYHKIAGKLLQHDSLLQQPKNEQLEKLKIYKNTLEQIMTLLHVSKSNILPGYKEKLGSYEKKIINILNLNRRQKPGLQLHKGPELPPSHMHSAQHSQQPQSHITQVQPHENQMNPQMQSMNLQGSVATMQENNVTSPQHISLSSLSGFPNTSQSMISSVESSSNFDSDKGNALNTLQKVSVGSQQQNPASAQQQINTNSLSSQIGMNALQPHLSLLSNSNMLQQQALKRQEQQMQPRQQLKQQFQQPKMQQQQLHWQTKQQHSAQLQAHQMPQLHQLNDVNDLKLKPQMGVKSGVFQQHHSAGQLSAYHHQQLKSVPPFPISSPQLLEATSPQMPQHSSTQFDQKNLLTSLTKAGTSLQAASSPFIVPSPSTPVVPSPSSGESEKINSSVSALPNTGNIGHQQTAGAVTSAQSLAIGTPGISASPLLAEFTSLDGNHGNASTIFSGESSVTAQPFERLIKAVKSISPKALSASVNDIGSVVSLIDRIAGSVPGNGSRAAVREDLASVMKCLLRAKNFTMQDGNTRTRKMKRYTSAMPLNSVSSSGSMNNSFKPLTGSEASDLEWTATSGIKRPRIEGNHDLLEEIREINQRLVDTVVDISDEEIDPTAAVAASAEVGEGTIIKCSFSAFAVSPNLKPHCTSVQMSPILDLRLLIPTNYPNCSPILLDKFPDEVSNEYEDLSVKAKSTFSISLRNLSQPMSLGEIAKAWDVCARAVIFMCTQKSGGGNFSSRYGMWENCLSAA